MRRETLLNVFPAADSDHRLVVAVEQESADAPSRLVLRQETHSDDVGWFVQSRVAIEPEQISGLKMVLTSQTTRSLQAPPRNVPRMPAILRFDGVHAG